MLEQELAPFRRLETPGPLLEELLADVPRVETRTIDMLVDLNVRVQKLVAYIVRMEPGVWTPEQTLGEGRGSCRDSAWLLVHVLRHLGFAARFVSGYLIQLVADEKPLAGPEGPTSDFTDLHAWAEVYLPGAGLDRARCHVGLAHRRGPCPACGQPRPDVGCPHFGRRGSGRSHLRRGDEGRAGCWNLRASPNLIRTRNGVRSWRQDTASTRRWRRAMCV